MMMMMLLLLLLLYQRVSSSSNEYSDCLFIVSAVSHARMAIGPKRVNRCDSEGEGAAN
jgi:hypothetical protein